jgi:hypothetical protein
MFFPLAQLTITRAVPSLTTFRAPLSRQLTTLSAFRILQELLEDFIGIELHHSVHVFFGLLGVRAEEMCHLVCGNFFPISTVHNLGSQLGKHLHKERIGGLDIGILHECHLFKTSQHRCEHGQLIQQNFIHVLFEAH